MFRAIAREFGPAKGVISVEPYEPLSPGSGQVRIRMLVSSINPSDLVTISGAYRARTSLPFIPGFEGVGVIESVGASVSKLLPGQRVLPLGSAGAWQTVKITDERWCFPVPDDLTDEQAAMAYINPMTACMMVREYAPSSPFSPGTPVAVNAATSAIGRMIIRLLKHAGVHPIIALVRRPNMEGELMAQLGVDAVLCTSSDEGRLRDRLLEVTGGRGLAVAWDAVGGPQGDELVRALQPGGTLVHYGLLSGTPLSWSLREECLGARIALFRLRDWIHSAERGAVQQALEECFQLIREGVAASNVAAVFPLSDIRQALESVDTPGREGKVLLSLRDP
ncbi:chaperonin 10-like protein [Aspergillus pseudoustus]|uniref:Chaperonin 10-like protein n=1 Tax=Aspergillus pseudoustus TaxID=1810923 RepID=A0ABR4JA66_9EURO